jgi:hypothetical protein
MSVVIDGTTGISGNDGSAATPALRGEDTNTGVFFPAADTVAVATGGSERLRVDSSGNVGIGTTSPSTALQVNGTVTATTFAGNVTGSAGSTTVLNENGSFPTGDNQNFNSLTTGGYYNIVWGNFSGTLNTPSGSANSYGTLLVQNAFNFTSQMYMPHAGNSAPATRVLYAGSWTDWSYPIGQAQTWQAVSRAVNVSYQNTTGRPIGVSIYSSGVFQASTDNSTWVTVQVAPVINSANRNFAAAVIPNGHYYRISGGALGGWSELR